MTDWIMILLTGVYVIATIVICMFNWKVVTVSKKQVEEVKRQMDISILQFNEIHRPQIDVKFLVNNNGLKFSINNIGALPAYYVNINICDNFLNNLDEIMNKQEMESRLNEINDVRLYMAVGQEVIFEIGPKSNFKDIAKEKAVLLITYEAKENKKYEEKIEIDMSQYGSALLDISEGEQLIAVIKKGYQDQHRDFESFIKSRK